jgi:hypothetical protein
MANIEIALQNIPEFKFLQKILFSEKTINDFANRNKKIDYFKYISHLDSILNQFDSVPSQIMQYIDKKGQDLSTYFLIAYYSTHNVEFAMWTYHLIKLLVRYILLFDRYYEIDDKNYCNLALKIRKEIDEMIENKQDSSLKYSIDYALQQFWPFWKYEKFTKQRMIEGNFFSGNDIKYHNLFKSSDSFIIYASVLESIIPRFNKNISLILHYNQALLDIEDDLEDIEDDLTECMPNVFIMATMSYVSYNKIKNTSQNEVRNLVIEKSRKSIVNLIEEYKNVIRTISLPKNFIFLQYLSDVYLKRLTDSLSILKSL